MQLIAITGEGEARRVVLYDQGTDALRTLAVGDVIDRRTVASITADSVELALGPPFNITVTLTLKPPDGQKREAPR